MDSPSDIKRSEQLTARDGVDIAYEVVGDGPRMLLLANGLGGRLYSWAPLLEEFGREFRIVTWDYRGIFDSSSPKGLARMSIRDQAEDGREIMRAEGADRAVWFGWSMGVQVALEAAAIHPAAVAGLVLLNGTYGHVFSSAFQPGLRLPFLPRYIHDLLEFLQQHPQTQIELIALERAVNLVEERIDLAVRIGNKLDETLVARRLGVCRSVLCASPAYLAAHGMPATPDDLRTHRCISHANVSRVEFRLHRDGQAVRVPITAALQSNDTAVVRQATLDGGGIAQLPTYFVAEDLVQGRLVHVLPAHEPEVLGIHAVYLSRQHQPLLLRVMLDFLAERFSGELAPWDRAIEAAARAARPARGRARARTQGQGRGSSA